MTDIPQHISVSTLPDPRSSLSMTKSQKIPERKKKRVASILDNSRAEIDQIKHNKGLRVLQAQHPLKHAFHKHNFDVCVS